MATVQEGPLRQVRLDPYLISKYEITQGQWEAVMGEKPWLTGDSVPDDPSFPAVYVSWDDVQVFIQRLNDIATGVQSFGYLKAVSPRYE